MRGSDMVGVPSEARQTAGHGRRGLDCPPFYVANVALRSTSPVPLVLPSSLTVSVVTYRSDSALLERCLARSRSPSAPRASERVLKSVAVALIDNSEDRSDRGRR